MRAILLAVALTSAASVALASRCPMEMKAIDAKMATAQLSDADAAKVKKLRADGEAAHKAGNHAESERLLDEAKKILGI